MSVGLPNNLGALAGGGAAAIGNPAAGGAAIGPGAQKPHPMGMLIRALKSGDPKQIQGAQQFLKAHPEVAQRLQQRLNDPASQQRMAARIQQHGGDGPGTVAKLKQLVDSAAPAAAQGVQK